MGTETNSTPTARKFKLREHLSNTFSLTLQATTSGVIIKTLPRLPMEELNKPEVMAQLTSLSIKAEINDSDVEIICKDNGFEFDDKSRTILSKTQAGRELQAYMVELASKYYRKLMEINSKLEEYCCFPPRPEVDLEAMAAARSYYEDWLKRVEHSGPGAPKVELVFPNGRLLPYNIELVPALLRGTTLIKLGDSEWDIKRELQAHKGWTHVDISEAQLGYLAKAKSYLKKLNLYQGEDKKHLSWAIPIDFFNVDINFFPGYLYSPLTQYFLVVMMIALEELVWSETVSLMQQGDKLLRSYGNLLKDLSEEDIAKKIEEEEENYRRRMADLEQKHAIERQQLETKQEGESQQAQALHEAEMRELKEHGIPTMIAQHKKKISDKGEELDKFKRKVIILSLAFMRPGFSSLSPAIDFDGDEIMPIHDMAAALRNPGPYWALRLSEEERQQAGRLTYEALSRDTKDKTEDAGKQS